MAVRCDVKHSFDVVPKLIDRQVSIKSQCVEHSMTECAENVFKTWPVCNFLCGAPLYLLLRNSYPKINVEMKMLINCTNVRKLCCKSIDFSGTP